MKWRRIIPLKSKTSIKEVEDTFQITFPQDFVKIVTDCNAGIPIPTTFDTERVKGKDFGELLNFNLDESFNILHIYNLIEDRIPENVFPFAGDAGGNYLCFDFRESQADPIIRFWDHEMKFDIVDDRLITSDSEYAPDDYHLDFVSNSLHELLESLYGEEEDEITSPFSDEVLDIFINTYNNEQLLELDASTLNQINKRLIARGLPIVSKNENAVYKTYLGKDYTKEEWEIFEEKEYQKYLEKRSGKKSSFLADEETEKKNFSAETGRLKEVKYFVMNSKQDKVPVYEFPSTMVAPFTFLENGTAVEIAKFDKNGWCEIRSKDGKKGFIQANYVKKND